MILSLILFTAFATILSKVTTHHNIIAHQVALFYCCAFPCLKACYIRYTTGYANIILESDIICSYIALGIYINVAVLYKPFREHEFIIYIIVIMVEFFQTSQDWVGHQILLYMYMSNHVQQLYATFIHSSNNVSIKYPQLLVITQWMGFAYIAAIDIYTTQTLKWYLVCFMALTPFIFALPTHNELPEYGNLSIPGIEFKSTFKTISNSSPAVPLQEVDDLIKFE